MGRDVFKLLLVIAISVATLISAESDEDTWLDPDAWARDHLISAPIRNVVNAADGKGKCRTCSERPLTALEDSASLIYFKKFITMLFNRKNYKYDSNRQIYERSIVFTIQSFQMDKLEQLQDPRDLDSILTEIFNNAHTPYMYRDGQQHTTEASHGLKRVILNLIYDILQLSKTSEIRFLLVVSIITLVAWIFNNRFNIGWVPLVFGGIFIYGYLHTYLECNRELEVNQMLEILNIDEGSKTAKGSRFLNFFKEMFYSKDPQSLEKQKIKQSAKLSLGFCRPDHVFIRYFNDIFFTYLQVLIEQCTVTLTSLNCVLSFPYNILSGFLLLSLIGYILKLTFKYLISPSAWVQFMHPKKSYQSDQAAIKNTNSQDDRISGDNLKLLLKAFNAVPQRVSPTQTTETVVSGVEELKTVELNLEKITPQLDNSIVTKTKSSNLNEKSLDEKTDVNIKDLLEDS